MPIRAISPTANSAIEMLFAPLLMVGPFLLGFEPTVGLATFALGALLMGVAVTGAGDRRSLPLSAHAGFDAMIGTATATLGVLAGIAGGQPVATVFLVGFGAAHLALTAFTRYSARGA